MIDPIFRFFDTPDIYVVTEDFDILRFKDMKVPLESAPKRQRPYGLLIRDKNLEQMFFEYGPDRRFGSCSLRDFFGVYKCDTLIFTDNPAEVMRRFKNGEGDRMLPLKSHHHGFRRIQKRMNNIEKTIINFGDKIDMKLMKAHRFGHTCGIEGTPPHHVLFYRVKERIKE